MKTWRAEEGFSLIELMVVLVVIGILVAIAIPVFNAASSTARRNSCQTNLRTMDGAVQQWAASNTENDITTLDDIGVARGALATYVKDVVLSTTCPATSVGYGVTDGDFSCGVADHNYE